MKKQKAKSVVSKKTESQVEVKVSQRTIAHVDPLEYRIVADRKIDLTKKRAFGFLEMETFPGERDVRQTHVQFLFDEYMAGRFLWDLIILASAELDGKTFRINGQHTCWMRVNVQGLDDDKPHIVRELVYKVEDSDQLRALYSAFDRGAPRTAAHVAVVQLMDTDAARGVPPSMIRHAVAGFRVFSGNVHSGRGSSHTGVNPNEVIGIIREKYPSLFVAVAQFLREHYDDNITVRRAPVVGAMFATFERGIQKAVEFWSPVFNGLGLEDMKDPRYVLREFLSNTSLSVVKGGKKVSQEVMYRCCINCWNHWRDQARIGALKPGSLTGERPKAKS